MKKKIKKFKVDGITVLALYINDVWIMDTEIMSDFTEKEIRKFYKEY